MLLLIGTILIQHVAIIGLRSSSVVLSVAD